MLRPLSLLSGCDWEGKLSKHYWLPESYYREGKLRTYYWLVENVDRRERYIPVVLSFEQRRRDDRIPLLQRYLRYWLASAFSTSLVVVFFVTFLFQSRYSFHSDLLLPWRTMETWWRYRRLPRILVGQLLLRLNAKTGQFLRTERIFLLHFWTDRCEI